jgi:hypothetical protein
LSVIETTFSAIRNAMSSPSMAQGPHKRKKLLESECFIFGIVIKATDLILSYKDNILMPKTF